MMKYQRMPTLLSVNNYYYNRGGAETVFLGHNRMFSNAGWDVVPFAMQHARNLPSPWQDYFVDEIEFGSAYSRWEQITRVPRVLYSLQARQRLGALLDRTRPNICHGHNIYHHISPSILGLLKRRSIPVVLTLHDLKIACPAYSMLASDGICERCRGGRLYNVAIHRCIKGSLTLSTLMMAEAFLHRLIGSYTRCVDRFIVPSKFYAAKLQEWGYPAEMFRHVPNFVDTIALSPDFRPGNRFVYFGRLSREKGLRTLIKAAAKARCLLTIVGTGPDDADLRQLAVDMDAKVEFLGYLAGKHLHDTIRSARAVVLPSEWFENAPMSVLEAYALGKPVLGARIGGIPELILDGVTGQQFASGDVDMLTEALVSFSTLSDREVSEMGQAARDWVEQNFSTNAYLTKMLGVYGDLGVSPTRQIAI